jgi:type IV secretion system protein VirB9
VKLVPPLLLLIAASAPSSAQTTPMPGTDDPRLQTLVERPGEPARLVAFPDASLTLIMRQGERVQRVVLSDSSAFRVTVTGDNDSVSIRPLRPGALARMQVETGSGNHEFNLETGRGLAAAYVVRLIGSSAEPAQPVAAEAGGPPDLSTMTGRYRLDGDRTLRPHEIADDGAKTYLEWGREQALPAVLGIGPTGQEEVVAGFMRDDIFTIDRVYSQLVFRIDKHKTVATRETGEERR